jgi:acyl-coenzyme A thioesterase PaaI-like protein
VDSTAIAEIVHTAEGFVRTLGPRVLRSSEREAVLRLDAGPELYNHVGGPHAAAIFGLGETAALVVLLEVFGELAEQGAVPLVKSADISYSALATGPLLATARVAGARDEVVAGVRASMTQRGLATFDVEIAFTRESDGGRCGAMTARMALKRLGQDG